MDLDTVADELYAGPRESFIATRAEHAAAASKAGDKELAKRIKALRKPSVAAALVNRLAREHADDLAELTALGEELRGAHADLDGERLRELSVRKRATVERVAEQIKAFGSEPTAAVLDQVTGTLEAATTSADLAATVAAGRLDKHLEPGGFDQWLIAPVNPTPRPRRPAPDAVGSDAAATDADPQEQRRQRKLAEATEQLAEAEEAKARAEEALGTAEDAAAEAARTAAELQARLVAAERELRKRRDHAGQARRTYDAAVRAADGARRTVNRLDPG